MTTTTAKSKPTVDPHTIFQFYPDPRFVHVEGGVESSEKNADKLILQRSNTSSSIIASTTEQNVEVRVPQNGERPAVAACRAIDAMLEPLLTTHIIDGIPASLGEYPHMAAIGYSALDSDSGPYEFRCGGSLIHRQFVLTAAHCVVTREARPTLVRLGAVDFDNKTELENAVEIKIKQIHVHPQYASKSVYDDIALLELERPVEFNENIRPVCLYANVEDPPLDSVLYVTGWGTVSLRTRKVSNLLLKAPLRLAPLEQCNATFVQAGLNRRISHGIVNTQLCAKDPGFTKDACQGDSGGPLNLVVDESLKKYRILGVISTGFGCADTTPGIYTRVAAYLDYIESIVWPQR